MATYIRRRRHIIAQTTKGRTLLEKCRGGEAEQEFEVFPRLFYDETGYEVNVAEEGAEMCLDPRERRMDHPGAAAPDNFVRGADLDG